MKISHILLFLFCFRSGVAQKLPEGMEERTDKDKTTIFIYYSTAKSDYTSEQTEKIMQLIRENDDQIEKIQINGYCDTLGKQVSNQTLSEKRAGNIHSFLTEKNVLSADKINFKGMGETGEFTDKNFYKNRRTEILLYWKNKEPHKEFVLKQGCNSVTIPKGAYDPYDINDLEITFEIIDSPEKMTKHKIKMQDDEGNNLVSGGMFYFSVKYKGKELIPSEPVNIKIEANQFKTQGMQEYDGRPSSDDSIYWAGTGKPLEKKNNAAINCEFYEFLMAGNGYKNADKRCFYRGGIAPPDKRDSSIGFFQLNDSTEIYARVFQIGGKTTMNYQIEIIPLKNQAEFASKNLFTQFDRNNRAFNCEVIFELLIKDENGNPCGTKDGEVIHIDRTIKKTGQEPLLTYSLADSPGRPIEFKDTSIKSVLNLGSVNCEYYSYISPVQQFYSFNTVPLYTKETGLNHTLKIKGKKNSRVFLINEKAGTYTHVELKKKGWKKYECYLTESSSAFILKKEQDGKSAEVKIKVSDVKKKKNKFIIRKNQNTMGK